MLNHLLCMLNHDRMIITGKVDLSKYKYVKKTRISKNYTFL